MFDKDLAALGSIFLTVVATLPYMRKMLQGRIKPHIFTWVIWTLTTGIAAAARTAAHAGPGAWSQWAGAASCLSVVIFAYSKGEHNITRSDIFAFAAALTAIPAWLLTKDPLVATVIVTAIDLVGYYPTFRKAYYAPHHEGILTYMVGEGSHILSLAATVDYSLTTVLFPSALFTANAVLVIYVWWRRGCVPLLEVGK